MKALSLKQPWANMVAEGLKTIETRTWSVSYRGPLLIVSSKKPDLNMQTALPISYHPLGHAIAIAELVECRPMTREDEAAAKCAIYWHAYSWLLKDIRRIEKPFPVKGKLHLYEVEIPEGMKTLSINKT